MNLRLKLLFAGLSGCLVTVVWLSGIGDDTVVSQVAMYGSCGGLFMLGVLSPYIKRQNLFSWRSAALLLVSSISFFCAIYASIEWSTGKMGPGLQGFLIGSVIGASIVLIAAPFLLSLRFSVKYVVVGALAAVVGGVAFEFFVELFGFSVFIAFALWHMLMCLTLHVANPGAANDSWLVGLGKQRIRLAVGLLSFFVIVPLADNGIGALLQHRFNTQDGDIKRYEPFNARGFFDQRTKPWFNSGCQFGCITLVRDGTLDFQEYSVNHKDGDYLLFFVGDNADPNCHSYGGEWDPPLEPTWGWSGKGVREDGCLTYKVSDEPTAEYAVRHSTRYVDAVLGIFTLTRITREVVRRSDDVVVVEKSYFRYDSRFFGESYGEVEPWPDFLEEAFSASELPE